jgi:hypothetical protein
MSSSSRSVTVLLISAFVLLNPAAILFASPINYGNLNGVSVVYQQITEDSTTDPTPLFGQPSVADDSLLFSPVSFGASATGAGGIDLTDGTLATSIVALQNSRIKKLQFSEFGDYSLYGNGTASTSAQVMTTLFIRVTHVDGGAITPVTFTANMLFSPSDGSYNLIDDHGIGVLWQGGIVYDVTAALQRAGYLGEATKLDLTLDNTLVAMSEAGTVAYIKKKQLNGVSITTIVPEPSAFALLGCGILGLLAYGWGSRKK